MRLRLVAALLLALAAPAVRRRTSGSTGATARPSSNGYRLTQPRYGATRSGHGRARLRHRGLLRLAAREGRPRQAPGDRRLPGAEAQRRARLPDRHLRLQHDDVDLRCASRAGWPAGQGQLLEPGVVRAGLAPAHRRATGKLAGSSTATSTARPTARTTSPCPKDGVFEDALPILAARLERRVPEAGGEPHRAVPAEPASEPAAATSRWRGRQATISRAAAAARRQGARGYAST